MQPISQLLVLSRRVAVLARVAALEGELVPRTLGDGCLVGSSVAAHAGHVPGFVQPNAEQGPRPQRLREVGVPGGQQLPPHNGHQLHVKLDLEETSIGRDLWLP
uniref:Putative secreted protein n=1 Tax=Ixodes ricinus TaxID=34613 RepID=A0A6B0UAP9_IXORI